MAISVSKIATNKPGIYFITYKITNSKGVTGKSVRTVNVYKSGSTILTITLSGDKLIEINLKRTYTEPGYTAQSGEEVLTSRVIVEGTVDTTKVGTYIIKYLVKDSNGNITGTSKIVTIRKSSKLSLSEIANVEDYISMTPDSTSYISLKEDNGYTNQAINPSELNVLRVLSASDSGIEVISENISSTKIWFMYLLGYQNYIGALNKIAAQYTNSKYVIATKHFGYNGQIEYTTDTSVLTQTTLPWTVHTPDNSNESVGGGDVMYIKYTELVTKTLGTLVANDLSGVSTAYFINSRFYYYFSWSKWGFCLHYVNSSGEMTSIDEYGYNWDSFYSLSISASVRPMLTLNSNSLPSSGTGTSDDPYVLNK